VSRCRGIAVAEFHTRIQWASTCNDAAKKGNGLHGEKHLGVSPNGSNRPIPGVEDQGCLVLNAARQRAFRMLEPPAARIRLQAKRRIAGERRCRGSCGCGNPRRRRCRARSGTASLSQNGAGASRLTPLPSSKRAHPSCNRLPYNWNQSSVSMNGTRIDALSIRPTFFGRSPRRPDCRA
jgi:hypothetical protein